MRLMNKISAVAIAAAAATAMTITAYAGTSGDAVQAAKEAGVQSINAKQLENFLEVHQDCFTAEQYDEMVADINSIRDKYISPKAKELFGKNASQLSDDEKVEIAKSWDQQQKQALIGDLVSYGRKYQVSVTAEQMDEAHFNISAEHKHKVGADKMAGGTTIKADAPVAPTGESSKNSPAAVAMACAALAISGTCVILATRKNKT